MIKTAIQVRLEIFDKWKILIPHDSDRKDFQGQLVELDNMARMEGHKKGLIDAEEIAKKLSASKNLPLERKPNQ